MALVSVPMNASAVKEWLGPQVGDIHSDARGSGARFNAGKPPVELLLWREVAELLPGGGNTKDDARDSMAALGDFQESRNPDALQAIVACLFDDPTHAMREAARVFAYGAKKYAAWNWAKGMAWSVPVACAGRHLLAIYRGLADDTESGLPHAGHVVCNVMMLSAFARLYPEGDDLPRLAGRYASEDNSENIRSAI